MKNHAFLVQVHAYPSLLKSLISRLEKSNHYFFIHIDKKVFNDDDFQYLSDRVWYIPKKMRYNVNWGAVEQVYLTIDLLKEAQKIDVKFDFYHLISGQDYSILSASEFDAYFENQFMSFMEVDTAHLISNRYSLYHFNSFINPRKSKLSGLLARLIRLQSILNKYVRLRTPFPFPVYKGCNWWSLTDEAVNYILQFLHDNPWYLKRFRFTSCCDEVFFHTILLNSPLKKKIMLNSLRYTEWEKGKSSPRVLDEESYSKIVSSDCVFMRKIDEHVSDKLISIIINSK